MKLFSALFLGSAFVGAHIASASVSDTLEHHQTVGTDATVMIVNTNGRVSVETWDKSEVAVFATRTAKSAEDLAKVSVKFEGSEKRVSVRTDTPSKVQRTSVDYVVKVPSKITIEKAHCTHGNVTVAGVSGKVDASTVNGDVELKDVTGPVAVQSVNGNVKVAGTSGDIQARTVNGEIDLRLAQLASGASVEASTVNGEVEVAIPTNSSAKLFASTKNGSVKNDLGLPKAKHGFGGTSFEGVVGDGSAKIEVESVNGSIEFTKS